MENASDILNGNGQGKRNKKGKGNNSDVQPRLRSSNFSDDDTSLLLELLREIQIRGRRLDSSGNFKDDEWNEVHPLYNEQCSGEKRSLDKLRSRYKTVKKDFYVYKLLAEKSGWGWGNNNLPVAPSEECWSNLIKINKKYKGFKSKKFPWFKLMEEICGRNVAVGGNNVTFETLPDNIDSLNGSENSDNEYGDEDVHVYESTAVPQDELGRDDEEPIHVNNSDGPTEKSPQNQPLPSARATPSSGARVTRSTRKRPASSTGGEFSNSKRRSAKMMENMFEKVIEQNDRILQQQDARNNILSQFVTSSQASRSDPTMVCQDIMNKLRLNNISLNLDELAIIVNALVNPWTRGIFMNLDGEELRSCVSRMLTTNPQQDPSPPTSPSNVDCNESSADFSLPFSFLFNASQRFPPPNA